MTREVKVSSPSASRRVDGFLTDYNEQSRLFDAAVLQLIKIFIGKKKKKTVKVRCVKVEKFNYEMITVHCFNK